MKMLCVAAGILLLCSEKRPILGQQEQNHEYLKDLVWRSSLGSTDDGQDMFMEFALRGTERRKYLLGLDKPPGFVFVSAMCLFPFGDCRLLHECILPEFTENFDDFIPYACTSGSYVGVCCPLKHPRSPARSDAELRNISPRLRLSVNVQQSTTSPTTTAEMSTTNSQAGEDIDTRPMRNTEGYEENRKSVRSQTTLKTVSSVTEKEKTTKILLSESNFTLQASNEILLNFRQQVSMPMMAGELKVSLRSKFGKFSDELVLSENEAVVEQVRANSSFSPSLVSQLPDKVSLQVHCARNKLAWKLLDNQGQSLPGSDNFTQKLYPGTGCSDLNNIAIVQSRTTTCFEFSQPGEITKILPAHRDIYLRDIPAGQEFTLHFKCGRTESKNGSSLVQIVLHFHGWQSQIFAEFTTSKYIYVVRVISSSIVRTEETILPDSWHTTAENFLIRIACSAYGDVRRNGTSWEILSKQENTSLALIQSKYAWRVACFAIKEVEITIPLKSTIFLEDFTVTTTPGRT